MVQRLAPESAERRYKKDPYSKAELKRLLDGMADWTTAINLRHAVAKEREWAATPPSKTAFVAAAVDEPNLLRRPLIQRGSKVIYSRDAAEIEAFLA